MKVYSGYTTTNGTKVYYEILNDGFKLYDGENSVYPYIHQYEPYIPNPDISYEENALNMIKERIENENIMDNAKDSIETRITNIEANVDYLMLLNDSTDE